MVRYPHEHTLQQKAKARKSGPSIRDKTEKLAKGANVFAAVIYWDPTHLVHRVTAHNPEGGEIPDLNSMVSCIVNVYDDGGGTGLKGQ